MYKYLITGSSGLLGSAIKYFFDISNIQYSELHCRHDNYFASDFSSYDAIIHCAANTNVDQCQLDPKSSYDTNVSLTQTLLDLTPSTCKFIYISSTGVYGEKLSTPYDESVLCSPTTVHHTHKRFSESLVLSKFNSLILRVGWLFGDFRPQKNDFVFKRLAEMVRLSPSSCFPCDNTQFGNPTYTLDVAEAIHLLNVSNINGIFNLVNPYPASRLEYIKQIAQHSGLDIVIEPSSQPFVRPAPVSFNETATCSKYQNLSLSHFGNWRSALYKYLSL